MLSNQHKLLLMPLILATIAAIGCSDSHGIVPVSGTVTIDNQPLQQGEIVLYPSGSRPATGKIQDGHFVLTCFEPEDGAPVGTHPATVTATQYINDRTCKWYAPKKYSQRASSGLTVTIEGPTDDLEVKLSWNGERQQQPFIEKY